MRAQAGDWLVVERAGIDHEPRRGLIKGVASADGAPPYQVRWLDTGREALVFPGPEAHVESPAELEAATARASRRAAAVQRQIAARRGRS